MNVVFRCCVVLALWGTFAAGQEVTSRTWVISERAGGRSIPNPNSTLAMASLLRNSSVQKELRLSDDQRMQINKLLRDSRGSLTVSVVENPPDTVDVGYLMELERLLKKERLEEVISTSQLDRLKQLAFQIEISRVGLPTALIDGFFGQHIGIGESDKGAIEIVAKSIAEKAERRIAKLNREALEKFVELLTPRQKQVVDKCVGKLIYIRDFVPKGGTVIVEPNDLLSLAQLLVIETVASQLRLDKAERESAMAVLARMKQDIRMSASVKTATERTEKIGLARQVAEEKIVEILDPRQIDRLREMGYQVELSRLGLVQSLCSGCLGRQCDITDEQKREIREKGVGIVSQLDRDVTGVLEKAIASIGDNLTTAQKNAAAKLIGSVFVFKEDWDTQSYGIRK